MKKAQDLLNGMSIVDLVAQWEEVSKMEVTPEIATVRGWLMDALENKNPEAFDKYLDDENCTDEDLRKYFIDCL